MSLNANRVIMGGRGRGRLIPQEVLDTPLRKPGVLLPEKTNIVDKLARLDILFSGSLEDLVVYRVLDTFMFRDGCTESDMDKMMEHIFKNAMMDATNAIYICKYLYVMFRHNEKGSALRSIFFKYLQKYYQESSAIKLNHHAAEYRNLVILFAAAIHYARNVNFAPFAELIDALLELALRLVPSTKAEDIKVFSICVIRYAGYLTMPNPDGSSVNNLVEREGRLEEAKKFARKIYLNNEITKHSLAWLSLVIECYSITNELLEQYSPPLDQASLNLLKPDTVKIRLPKKDFARYSLTDVAQIIELV